MMCTCALILGLTAASATPRTSHRLTTETHYHTSVADATEKSEIKNGSLYVDGVPFFPIGIYVHSLNDTDWEWLKASGYNTVLTYTNGRSHTPWGYNSSTFAYTDAFLRAAEAHNMKVFLSLKDYHANKYHNGSKHNFTSLITSVVTRYRRGFPSLLGWYVRDEGKT